MANPIQPQNFITGFIDVLKETFERSQGIYLDPDNSIFETLAHISAEQASRPVGDRCATIAAQVKHVNFYLEVLEKFMRTGQNERVDWGEIWRNTREVTPEEWAALQATLNSTYQRMLEMIPQLPFWDDPNVVAGCMGLVAHSAYHLGEIRQACCTVL